jgi:general nucleoside transport system permease protein
VIPGRVRAGWLAIAANVFLLAVLFVGSHLLYIGAGGAASPVGSLWSSDLILVAAGLLFLGLAFLLPLHAGLLNLAIHAQFLAGFAVGSLITRYGAIVPGAQAGLGLLAGALAGAFTGALVAWFKRRFAIHEILSGLLLAAALTPIARSLAVAPVSPPALTIELGVLATPLSWAPGLKLPPSFVLGWSLLLLTVGLMIGLFAAHFLRASVKGFELRSVGSNPLAAVASGVEVDSIQMLMMALGGACAGLTGALQLWTEPAVALERWPFPLGFAGLTIAFLGSGYFRGSVIVALTLAVWLNTPAARAVLGDPGLATACSVLLVIPALWMLPRLQPDQGAPRAIWRTRHREPI